MRSKSRGTIVCVEYRARLVAQLADRVARRDVGQREHARRRRRRRARPRRGRSSGAVSRRASASSSHERRLVDEQVGLVGDERASCRSRRGVAGEHDAPAAARLAHHLLGRVDAVLTVSPRCEAAEVGAGRDAELLRALRVEAAGALVLDQRVADRAPAVVDRERGDPVAVAVELVVRLQLARASTGKACWPITGRARRTAARGRAARRPSAAARAGAARTSSACPAGRARGRRGSG